MTERFRDLGTRARTDATNMRCVTVGATVWAPVKRKPGELSRTLDADAFFRNVCDQVRRGPGREEPGRRSAEAKTDGRPTGAAAAQRARDAVGGVSGTSARRLAASRCANGHPRAAGTAPAAGALRAARERAPRQPAQHSRSSAPTSSLGSRLTPYTQWHQEVTNIQSRGDSRLVGAHGHRLLASDPTSPRAV